MGVIKRQGIKQSLVNYFAVAIGAVSVLFIYPIDRETYGLARFIIDGAMFLAPFLMLGFSSVTIRFFPHFKDEKKGHKGFLFFVVSGVSVGCILFLLLTILFKEPFYGLYDERPALYQDYLGYLIPIAILLAFFQLFYNYSSNFKRIVVPALYQNLIKVSLPVLILLFIWGNINRDTVVNGILLNFVIALAGLIIYVFWLGELKLKPDFEFFNKTLLKKIANYAFYGLFGGIGSVLAFRIDSLMISTLIDFENNGTYAIALFIANVIAIPTNAINQITAPILSEAFKENDITHVKMLYQRSSINLLVIGLLLFIGIVASVNDLFLLMPNGDQLSAGLAVVFFIGLSRIIDMGTSINNQIIDYSKFYRFRLYAILMLAVFNVVCNLIFIPKFQIAGAALATLASITLYNLVKFFYIMWKLDMQPFTLETIKILTVAMVVFAVAYFIPLTNNLLLNIVLRSIIIVLLYVPAIFLFRISPDIEELLKNGFTWIKKRF